MIDSNELLTKEEANQIKDLHDKISKSGDNRNHRLLTINTTIFAIVITLTTFDKTSKVLFYLYLSTLVLFLLSIFSGYILTNASGNLYRKTLDKYLEHLAEVKTGRKKESDLIVSSGWFHGVIFYIFEIGTYMALITLAAFTVMKQLI